MKENGYGRILNVGSTGSFIPSPTDAVYSATKAYIMSFSNALCGELGKAGIKVTTLCPGATETEFAAKANIQNTLLFRIAVMKPEKVVGIAYRKMMKGRRSKRFLLSDLPADTTDRRIWRMKTIVRRSLLNQWYLFQPRHNYFIIRIVILFVRLIGITLENTTNSLLYIPGITSFLPFIIL